MDKLKPFRLPLIVAAVNIASALMVTTDIGISVDLAYFIGLMIGTLGTLVISIDSFGRR